MAKGESCKVEFPRNLVTRDSKDARDAWIHYNPSDFNTSDNDYNDDKDDNNDDDNDGLNDKSEGGCGEQFLVDLQGMLSLFSTGATLDTGSDGLVHVTHHVPFVGSSLLQRALSVPSIVNMLLAPDPTVSPPHSEHQSSEPSHVDLSRCVFVDIETLDVSDSCVIMVGFARVERDVIIVDQYLVQHAGQERTLLSRIIEHFCFRAVDFIVTFYGKKFDIPFLRRRAQQLLQGSESINSFFAVLDAALHVDLYTIFKVHVKGLNRYNFKAFETAVIGIESRGTDIIGQEVKPTFNKWCCVGSPRNDECKPDPAIAGAGFALLKHNYMDVVHLVFGLHSIAFVIDDALMEIGGRLNVSGQASLAFQVPRPWTEPIMPTSSSPCTCAANQGLGKTILSGEAGVSSDTRPFVSLWRKERHWDGISKASKHDENIKKVLSSFISQPATLQAIKEEITSISPAISWFISKQGWFLTLESAVIDKHMSKDINDGITTYKGINLQTSMSPLSLAMIIDELRNDYPDIDEPDEASHDEANDYVEYINQDEQEHELEYEREENQPRLDTIEKTGIQDSREPSVEIKPALSSHDSIQAMVPALPTLTTTNESGQGTVTCPDSMANRDHVEENTPSHHQGKSRDLEPSQNQSQGIELFDSQTRSIINGWLIACGSLEIDEVARILSKNPDDIKLHLFGEIGRGTIQARFKDRVFMLEKIT